MRGKQKALTIKGPTLVRYWGGPMDGAEEARGDAPLRLRYEVMARGSKEEDERLRIHLYKRTVFEGVLADGCGRWRYDHEGHVDT